MDHFEEVSEWLGSSSSTPKHANLSLIDHPASISNVETPSFTSLIAEPVTEPFTLNTAEFLISNSDAETKTCENRVLLNLRHESSGIKIESNWSSSSSTSSQHLTVNTSEIAYHPIILPTSSKGSPQMDRDMLSSKSLSGESCSTKSNSSSNWSPSGRRMSHETLSSSGGDSGFFNVPTPPGSYASSHSQDVAVSPYSAVSIASSPQSNSFPDLYNTNVGEFGNQRSPQEPPPSNNEDLELEKIVDDVDNMYREQLRKKAEEDLKENINVIRRNLPAKKDGIAGYLSQTTQEIADQIARNLVDRALELDRKRLVKKIVKLSADSAEEKLKNKKAEMLNNFAEVAVSRVTDQLTTDLIKAASQDVANVMQHKCDGNPSRLTVIDFTRENTTTLLNQELSKLVCDLVSELPASENTPNYVGQYNLVSKYPGQDPTSPSIADPTAKPNKKKRLSPAMQKRETLRRARNKNGILLSSLKKKIYHCNCVDCQAKRVAEGKPAYLEPIFVEEMDLGDLPDSIPMVKKKSRGRPRKYPRLDDVLRYKNSLESDITEDDVKIQESETTDSNAGSPEMPSIKEAGEDQKSIQSTRNSSKLRLLLTQQNQQKKKNYRRLPWSPAIASALASASEKASNEKAIQTKDNLEAIKRTVTAATVAAAEAAEEVECLLVVNKAEIKTEKLPTSRTTVSGELSQQEGYNEDGAGYDWILRNNSIASPQSISSVAAESSLCDAVTELECCPNSSLDKEPSMLLEEENCCLVLPEDIISRTEEEENHHQQVEKRHQEDQELRKQLPLKKLLPLNCRPGPLSAKKKWISAMKRTKPRALVKLRPCHVPLDSEKAVCQAFMAQLKRIQSKKKPPPNPQFILRPPLRMAE